MPAAAVIPAPIVYTNAAAVKKLVVESDLRIRTAFQRNVAAKISKVIILGSISALNCVGIAVQSLYCEQMEVFKASLYA